MVLSDGNMTDPDSYERPSKAARVGRKSRIPPVAVELYYGDQSASIPWRIMKAALLEPSRFTADLMGGKPFELLAESGAPIDPAAPFSSVYRTRDRDTFNALVAISGISMQGDSTVFDGERLEHMVDEDQLNFMFDAMEKVAKGYGSKNIVVTTIAQPQAWFELETIFAQRGFRGDIGEYKAKTVDAPSPTVGDCVVTKIPDNTALPEALRRNLANLCDFSGAVLTEQHVLYIAKDSTTDLPCAVAFVNQNRPDKWVIDSLCSIVPQAGRAVFDNVMEDAREHGVGELDLVPETVEWRREFKTWGPTHLDEEEEGDWNNEYNGVVRFDPLATLHSHRDEKRRRMAPGGRRRPAQSSRSGRKRATTKSRSGKKRPGAASRRRGTPSRRHAKSRR